MIFPEDGPEEDCPDTERRHVDIESRLQPSTKLLSLCLRFRAAVTSGQSRTVISQSNGVYLVPFLVPSDYKVEVSAKGFKSLAVEKIEIHVTETATLDLRLEVGAFAEVVTVKDIPALVQTDSSALGNVTDQRMVENLPLVTRNYMQILGLSPGVSGEITDAAMIGRGPSGLEYSTSGNIVNDNNFQMNGSEVNDLMGSGSTSGGIPVPNPDSIQEFKVQTGQYDASYGRNAGANVDVVTKSGTNAFHGDVWEYFRNTALNANNFFLKQKHQPRGVLNQNQFGGTLGGPIKKDKVFFFGSYQGTREKDGLDVTGGCLSGGSLPIGLTNNASDRTAAALASTFGVPMIDPTALAVLNAQLPNGQFVIPAPQSADGTSAFSSPCPYIDNQFVSNLDFYQSETSHLSGKFFFLDSTQTSAFPGNNIGITTVTVPGFPQSIDNGFRDFSLTHTYTINDHLVNQAVLGYHRTSGVLDQVYPKTSFANTPASIWAAMARESHYFKISTTLVTRSPTFAGNIRCASEVESTAARSMSLTSIFWLRLPTCRLMIFWLEIHLLASMCRACSDASGAHGTATCTFRMITKCFRA